MCSRRLPAPVTWSPCRAGFVSPSPEPLQPQDLVITLLGTYVRPFGDAVWSGGLVALLEELGFSRAPRAWR